MLDTYFSMAVTSAIPARRAIGVYQCEVCMEFLLIWRIYARYAFQSAKNRVVKPELANRMTIPQRHFVHPLIDRESKSVFHK